MMSGRMETCDVGEILHKIIDNSIRSIIGDSGAFAVYYHIRSSGVDSKKLAHDPQALENAMKEIFKLGWDIFKKAILSSLCEHICKLEKKNPFNFDECMSRFAGLNFVDCINTARHYFNLPEGV